jgi:hypothetical protein
VTKFDDIAWPQIESRPVPQGQFADHYGLAKSGRPASFSELEQMLRGGKDFTLAWCMLLDEFYLFRRVEFFAAPPSTYFDPRTRAWFAGVVEYLCHRFGLPVPCWVQQPEYFLPEPWVRSHSDTGEPEFRRRNILYNPRNLIRL